uniref:Uncharacterized protein n=1 Tax=Plectus sambesii TaxID=2011161 RepID=A0A914VPR3_9BILA
MGAESCVPSLGRQRCDARAALRRLAKEPARPGLARRLVRPAATAQTASARTTFFAERRLLHAISMPSFSLSRSGAMREGGARKQLSYAIAFIHYPLRQSLIGSPQGAAILLVKFALTLR